MSPDRTPSDRGDRQPTDDADVCVIGAGPAGALIAHRLAVAGHDVVVLEAGPRFDPADRLEQMDDALRPAHGRTDIWGMGGPRDAFTSGGERHYPLNHARVKGVGGSTLHWQGMVMRLHERDFEMQTRYGLGVDWPLDYDDLRPGMAVDGPAVVDADYTTTAVPAGWTYHLDTYRNGILEQTAGTDAGSTTEAPTGETQ